MDVEEEVRRDQEQDRNQEQTQENKEHMNRKNMCEKIFYPQALDFSSSAYCSNSLNPEQSLLRQIIESLNNNHL